MSAPQHSFVDVAFLATGSVLPLDHGYPLFSALSRLVSRLHQEPTWGVHPVLGTREGNRLLLESRSRVRIRMPLSEIAAIMPLAGARIEVAGMPVTLGFPQISPLVPTADIRARLITIRGFREEQEFIAALRRQLQQLGHEQLGQDPAAIEVILGRRRIVKIRDKKVVGFAVGLSGLSADASLAIQRQGLGGRRHMGAGLFVPPGTRASILTRPAPPRAAADHRRGRSGWAMHVQQAAAEPIAPPRRDNADPRALLTS